MKYIISDPGDEQPGSHIIETYESNRIFERKRVR